jgi:hypothetical protein
MKPFPLKIIISSLDNYGNERGCLGHEIHITRCIIIDMLLQNFINKHDVIIVGNNDKKFLYNILFDNVLTCHEFNWNLYNHIDLTMFTLYATSQDYHKNFNIITPSKPYLTYEFKERLLSIEYCHVKCDEKFVLIHQRFNDSIDNLKCICKKIKEVYGTIKIIVFNNAIEKLEPLENTIFINNLQTYASYLHHPNCILFISEWSGGGQLSQYCYSGKILYYFNFYNVPDFIGREKEFIELASISYFDNWDWKNPNHCCIQLFKNVNEMIDNLN